MVDDRAEDRLDPAVWRIASVVLLGPLLTNLDTTIVSVSLETLRRELGSPLTTIQWVTTAYLLSLALVLPLSGWLVDRVGAKRVYLGCFIVFTLTSLLCGAATSAGMLIAFRVLQGVSGGLLAPMAQMMAARIAGKHVAKMMAFIAAPVMVGPILGPSLAGFIAQHASWRWIFFINLPVGVVATIAAWRVLPPDRDTLAPRSFDLLGFVLLSPALVMTMHSLENLGAVEGRSLLGGVELSVGLVLLLAFLRHSVRHGRAALVDVHLFRKPSFRASALTQFFSNAIVFGGQLVIPLLLLTGGGYSPSKTGIVLAFAGVGMLVAYPVVGRMTGVLGPRRTSATGAVIALVFTLPFAVVPITSLSMPVICGLLLARGAGLGSINIPSIAAAYTGMPHADIPVATTAINIVQRLGGPFATTILALFHHAALGATAGDTPSAFLWTMRMLSFLHVLPVLAALRLPQAVSSTAPDRHAPALAE